MSRNPFAADYGGGTKKRGPAKPSTLDKQATVFAAEQNLKPWELPQSGGKPKPQKPAPLNTRYKAAVVAPVSDPARQYLAATETPRRRQQYERIIAPPAPAPPHGDTSFLHALFSTPRSVYEHGIVPDARAVEYAAKQATGQGTYKKRPFSEDLALPAKTLLGNSLFNAVTQGQTSHLGAAGLEAAALFPPFKGLRVARDAVKAAEETVRGTEAAKPLYHIAPTSQRENIMRGGLQDKLTGKGVFLWDNPDDARAYLKLVGGGDVWEVKTQAGLKLEADPWWTPERRAQWPGPGSSVVAHEGIGPERLVRHEGVPALTAAEQGKQLVAGLPEASRMIRDEKTLRSKELGIRLREAQRRLEAGGYTAEARKHSDAALVGAMPTLRWNRFTEMTHETLDDMVHHIEIHPDFQGDDKFFKRKNTRDALSRIMAGYHPREFEIKLLREAFGDLTTSDLIDSVGFWKKNGNRVLDVIGIPRSLLSSFDLSAPLRQNLVFATSHPVLWSRNFKPMLKAFGSTEVQNQVVKNIVSDPNYDLMQRAELRFTDLGHDILKREEGFQSNYAETLTGGKISPVRASNRAYVTFNNKSRADLFNFLLEKVERLHPEIDWQSRDGDKMLKEMGRLVNNATGRGKFPVKALEKSLPILNATLFSPRLLASRLDVLSYPATIWTMNDVTRREALKQLGALTGAVTGVVGLAALAGAKIAHDPRNADFGKVRVGSTRFDVAGGFLQPVRLAAQIGPTRLGGGKIISSTTGKTLSLTDRKFGGANRLGIFLRFLESKESPPVGFIVNWSRGTDFSGAPFSVQNEAYNRLVPLLVQDARQAYESGDSNTGSVALAMAIYGIGMWGVGTQTYGPQKPTGPSQVPSNPFVSGSRGGSNPFASSSATATSNPFASSP